MVKRILFLTLLIFSGIPAFSQMGFTNIRLYLNGQQTSIFKVIELFPGDTMYLRFMVTPVTTTDSVIMYSNIDSVLPGANYNVTNALHQVGFFSWIPSGADVSLAPFTFTIFTRSTNYATAGPMIATFIGTTQIQVRVNKPGSIILNNGIVNLNRDIEVEAGTPMNLRFSSVNPASADSMEILSNVASVLTGATFITDAAKQQTANINFTPMAAQVNSQPYTFTVTYQDKAPVPKQYVYTINVKVRNAGTLGVANSIQTLNSFIAFPNPFTDRISFKLEKKVKAESIYIYNLLGQKIDEIKIQPSEIKNKEVTWKNAGQFAKGTYIARLVSDDKTLQTLRFIKQ